MWDRTLASARRFYLDLGGRLASWRLSVVLMVVAALYYAFLAIWAGSSPPHVVRNISSLVPFWLLYLLLLVNTALCLWKRLPGLRRDLCLAPRQEEATPDWTVETPGVEDPEAARALLRRLGYRVAPSGEAPVLGVRRRWSAPGTFLFHGAFFLVASGFFLTAIARQDATLWVAVGEDFTGSPDQFLAQSPPRLLGSGVSPRPFRVSRIRPEFWRDQLLFTTLEADIVLEDGRERTTRINRPLWVGATTFLRLSGFGYALRYELRDRQMSVLDSAFVKLDVFPPGQRDYFRIPDYPHRFYVEVLPDLAEKDGRPFTRSLNLADPGVVLRVFRGRLDLGGGLLRQDQGFGFEGLSLGFPEIRYWGELAVVRDPGIPVIFAGYVLGLAGLALKLRGRRQEILWRRGEPGRPGTARGWHAPRPDPRLLGSDR